jgi:hypothetical protein
MSMNIKAIVAGVVGVLACASAAWGQQAMLGRHADVGNAKELFALAHPKVAIERTEPEQNEFNGNSVVVSVDDGGVRIDVGFPTASLEINS